MKKVADFFCGMGGLAFGLSKYFHVIGYDFNRYSKEIFQRNNLGSVQEVDLTNIEVNKNPIPKLNSSA